ncbi:MAG: SusC/RagA family TonB-linked outer membrane protein [Cytophagaceae bacterium]|nr:SusC/RagA family TonB-linked outer membrane protein [Gemmatimonadaceae bacterium]
MPSLVVRAALLLALLSPAAASRLASQSTVTVRGRVTAQDDGRAVSSAHIVVVGTRLGAITDNNGLYAIPGVAATRVMLRVTRIGYRPATREVTVPETGDANADFSLGQLVATLEQVVTTATGEQARREFGNVQGLIAVDSVMKTAPATSFQELLQGRTAGLQVFQGTGVTGAGPAIRIRGLSSLSLTNDPLVIVDGARFDAGAITGAFGTSSTRLGDLNLQDIESVDIVKGPSAAALYGTAAANGVIVIKTKRGAAGARTRWTTFAEVGRVEQPSTYMANWRSWGRNINASGTPVGGVVQCTNARAALKQCIVDSLTSNNPYLNPLTSPFRNARGGINRSPRSLFGLQASGGVGLLRFFVSASREGETGPYVMPDTEIVRIAALRGTPPRERQVRPNVLAHDSYRGNFQLALSSNATLDVSAGISNRAVNQVFGGSSLGGFTFQFITAPGCTINCSAALRSDGRWTNGTQREYVGDIFSVEQRTESQRFSGSTTLTWTPSSWLQLRSTGGADQSSTYGFQLGMLGEGPNQGSAFGPTAAQGFSGKDSERNNVNRYSIDLGATATRQLTNDLRSRTTFGAQWFRDESYRSRLQGYGLGPGVTTPNSASQRTASEFTIENATYGAFVEQQLSHRDRLFGTIGARTDQNSAFGRTVGTTVYPRASLSWVVSDEGWFPRAPLLTSLRVRSAWGKAGVQPGTIAALAFLTPTTYSIGGVETPALRLSSVGNPALKPEVTTEFEGGVDIALFDSRLGIEATVFRKLSRDALYSRPLPPSYGAGATQFQNIGKVENRGYELTVDAGVLRTRLATWDVRLNGSHIRNRLVTIGDATLSTAAGPRNVVGYPINGLWDRPIRTYMDANGDGLLVESEITVDGAQAYRGASLPQYEAGLTNTVTFLRGALRLATLFDYRGQYYSYWQSQNQRCVSTANCRAVNDPTAPLDEQAAAVMGSSSTSRTLWGFFAPGDFIRLREASASYFVPKRWTERLLRGQEMSVVLSGRNLGMLWNRFPGLDPEANSNPGASSQDFTAEPPLRYFIGRVNIAF